MTTTTYSPARAARKAAARALRHRVRAALVRFLNGAHVTAQLATGALVTVSTHLANLGADAVLVRHYGSIAGKSVKKAFITATGRNPLTVWKLHNGRVIQVAAYLPDSPALTAGLASYARTAHLIPA